MRLIRAGTQTEPSKRFWYVVLTAALATFSALVLGRIRQSLAQDELHYFVAAQTLNETGVPRQYASLDLVVDYSPHLYAHTVALMFRLFGESEAVARLPGVASGVVAIVMVFLITKSLLRGRGIDGIRLAALVSLLYATTPMLIQGSAIVDIDNTILVPALLGLYWSFFQYIQEPSRTWAVVIALAMAVSLWSRVTTPFIAGVLLVGYLVASNAGLRIKAVAVSAVLSGAFLFLITWYLYSALLDVPFLGPFAYAGDAFLQRIRPSRGLNLGQVFQNAVYLGLWVGVFPLVLVGLAVKERGVAILKRAGLQPSDLSLASGVVLVVGYAVVGGATFGFPKYHGPAIPLLYCAVGVILSSKIRLGARDLINIGAVAVVLSSAVIQLAVMGDMLYALRYGLREAVAFALPTFPAVLKGIGLRVVLAGIAYSLISVVVLRGAPQMGLAGLLLLLSLGTNTGLAMVQAAGSYQTGYNYGLQGTLETAHYIRKRIPQGSQVIAPSEVVHYLAMPSVRHLPNRLWTSAEELQGLLENSQTAALTYSVGTNTIRQIQTISRSGGIQRLLAEHFVRVTIGSYVVWIRTNAGNAGRL